MTKWVTFYKENKMPENGMKLEHKHKIKLLVCWLCGGGTTHSSWHTGPHGHTTLQEHLLASLITPWEDTPFHNLFCVCGWSVVPEVAPRRATSQQHACHTPGQSPHLMCHTATGTGLAGLLAAELGWGNTTNTAQALSECEEPRIAT